MWNYRVVRSPGGPGEKPWLAIKEVYYDVRGNPKSVTVGDASVSGESKKDMKWQLREMRRALRKPVLDIGDIGVQRRKN